MKRTFCFPICFACLLYVPFVFGTVTVIERGADKSASVVSNVELSSGEIHINAANYKISFELKGDKLSNLQISIIDPSLPSGDQSAEASNAPPPVASKWVEEKVDKGGLNTPENIEKVAIQIRSLYAKYNAFPAPTSGDVAIRNYQQTLRDTAQSLVTTITNTPEGRKAYNTNWVRMERLIQRKVSENPMLDRSTVTAENIQLAGLIVTMNQTLRNLEQGRLRIQMEDFIHLYESA